MSVGNSMLLSNSEQSGESFAVLYHVHDETWHRDLITNCISISFIMSSNKQMKQWPEDKRMVIEDFSESGNGM